MGEPYEDDSCSICGSYNNDGVICTSCLWEILENEGIGEGRIKIILKKQLGLSEEQLNWAKTDR
ncbi:unnamed protein product [marine sediment metagenome]|uniref:Uncharacterized protein n=1 Tax=marine sediment metagenome TaxID=412755 RepID=X1F1P5_9ZZZZ